MIIIVIIFSVLSFICLAMAGWMYDLYMRKIKPFDESFFIFFIVLALFFIFFCLYIVIVIAIDNKKTVIEEKKMQEAIKNGKIYLTKNRLEYLVAFLNNSSSNNCPICNATVDRFTKQHFYNEVFHIRRCKNCELFIAVTEIRESYGISNLGHMSSHGDRQIYCTKLEDEEKNKLLAYLQKKLTVNVKWNSYLEKY